MSTMNRPVNRLLVLGGVVAGVLIVVVGIITIVIGAKGRSEVRHDLKRENIVGTPDMKKGGNPPGPGLVDIPTCDVANKLIKTGSDAKCFAGYMRIHALEATGGKTYADMDRFVAKDQSGAKPGNPNTTSDEKAAAIDPKSRQPVENPKRQVWVTETALSQALNTSYFAERVSIFSLVVGIVLVIAGIGLLVLTLGALRPTLGGARPPA
jgi:hypothetical protein